MTLADQIKTDAKVFVNPAEFGEAATYTPKGEADVPITGVLVQPSFDVETAQLINTRQNVKIRSADVATPKVGDHITIRGRVCRVEDTVIQTAGLHELVVEVGPAT